MQYFAENVKPSSAEAIDRRRYGGRRNHDTLEASPIPEACARLWGTDPVWFIYEQMFLREGGRRRPVSCNFSGFGLDSQSHGEPNG